MNKNYEAIHRYDFLTKDLLIEEYVREGLTDRQIAEKYNMPSKVVVWRKRKHFGIENKSPGKSNKNATKNRKFTITKPEAQNLLNQGKKFEEIAAYMGCSIIVAKRRFKELGLSRECKQVKNFSFYNIQLSYDQKQLLIGSLLGDGYATKHNAFYCIHSTKQADYFFHKIEILSNIHSGSLHYVNGIDPQGNPTKSIRFTTGCNRFIVKLRKTYYIDSKKIFPYEFLMKNLDAKGIAYWYMDDGCWHKKDKYVRIYINGFLEKDAKLVVKFFGDKFKIASKIHYAGTGKDGEKQFYLRFPKKESEKFVELVKDHMLECMKYKIGE